MDDIDKTILMSLIRNGRTTKMQLAKMLNITETAVRKRVRKLEDRGILVGYRAVVDYQKAGLIASITGVDTEPDKLWSVIEKIKRIGDVKSISLTSGDHMIMLEIVAEDIEQLKKVHREIETLKGVVRVCPAIILKKIE